MDTGTLGNCLMMCSKASFSWSLPHAVIVLEEEEQSLPQVSEARGNQTSPLDDAENVKNATGKK